MIWSECVQIAGRRKFPRPGGGGESHKKSTVESRCVVQKTGDGGFGDIQRVGLSSNTHTHTL